MQTVDSLDRIKVKKFRHFVYDCLSDDLSKEQKKECFGSALTALVSKETVTLSDDGKSFSYVSGKGKRKREEDGSSGRPSVSGADDAIAPRVDGPVTILLFYAYAVPQMTRAEQDAAIGFCYKTLLENGLTGRLRVAREGFNSTLTGYRDSVRVFTSKLREYAPHVFEGVDFKYVDGLPENQMLKVVEPSNSMQ